MWLFDFFPLNSENLICRGMDISKCFRGSLGIRDNESRLYMVGTYIMSSRKLACKKENTCSIPILVILPEWISQLNSCAIHNFLMVWNILITFGRSIDKDQKGCHVQERPLSLSSLFSYLPWNRNFVQATTPVLFQIIWYGHISGQVGVLHARMTTLALFFFLVISPD